MLIQNGNVVFLNEVKKADIRTEGRYVTQIADSLTPLAGEEVIDATSRYVFPGLIDMHVHLREPGFEGKEDIASGSAAAVKGGFTQICCMPNTNPVTDNAVVVSYIINRAKEVNLCKVRPIGAITAGENGEALAAIGKMKQAGAVALSDDGKPVMNSQIMRLAMEYASDFDLICLSHCEDKNLLNGGFVNEGRNSTITGLKGISRAVEDIMIAREICLAQALDLPVHICHVSTYSGVQMIRDAKKNGVKVTAESCPHYVALTDDIILSFDTNTKVNPPVREEKDRQAIIAGIADGTIDCIVTDHAPHKATDKNVEYAQAAFGISGLETSFALCYTYLAEPGVLTLPELARRMSYNPAKILHLEGGEIAEGKVADLMIADLSKEWTIDSASFVSKGKNTPFNGYTVRGAVECTIVDGKVKYSA